MFYDLHEGRYYNTLTNLMPMIESVDKSYLFDNSSEEYKLIAKIAENKLSLEIDPSELPNWFIDYVLKYYM
ncbi:hypothetical protein NYQ10_14805 [Flavobacterium johnsoniae]|uniref:hypothetical protein n=1 Tax=Flavobacterium johnsoniae TaxID=986 RepID=UPI0025B18266|nr:hypothetical protein [Flavobacterium johnsoniae]WJS93361.1 hypothetical protein NYQ10_14805 [Flavobacterium johnsoniae]